MTEKIRRGMRVIWKPEWRDRGDETHTFIAVTDEHPIDRDFDTSTIESTTWVRPIQTGANADMVESAEPYLPVATLTFMGLVKKGARVQLRRALGDRELSTTEETIALSTFRRLFRRFAKDCEVGEELRSGVEFPGDAVKGERLVLTASGRFL